MRAHLYEIVLSGLLATLYAVDVSAHDGARSCDATTLAQPSIERARAELKQQPRATSVRLALAERLIEASCYDDAVHLLEEGVELSPNDRAIQTQLRMARSFVGEREYLQTHPATKGDTSEAELRRLLLRCNQIGDAQACDEALAARPNDIALLTAKGDALLKEKRARDALLAFTRAQQVSATLAPEARVDVTARINAAQTLIATQNPPTIAPRTIAQSRSATSPASTARDPIRTASVAPQPVRTYSNIQPAGQSH